ncbi:leucyl aminopeptidase [Legionella israelensis]|uniref:leucyl aminopeptidase n=1 Tax=Legionella israelensis TaxID=454 RepID=UPI00117DEB97|nr:leucyl aminopeptidase [Legionella israelensis]QDP71878.1 leucyl aminopeptidase [Legionella israelensis]
MNYGLIHQPELTANECLVIGILQNGQFNDFLKDLNKTTDRLLERLSQKLHEPGHFLWQADVQGHSLFLIHCGKHKDYNPSSLKKRMKEIINQLVKQKIHSATICMPQLSSHSADWQLEQMLLQTDYQRYQLLDFKKKNNSAHRLEKISFYVPDASEKALQEAQSIAEGISFCRTLANLPANICTPSYLAEKARELSKDHPPITTNIIGPEDMQKMGMGSLLAVAKGSDEPPRLIEVQYQGNPGTAPIVLVGKGITFDSGGISIKPAQSMDEMKYDMAGGASVLGTIKACALLNLPLNVIGLVPCAENMLSGKAVKPGDIVTSMSGQTIEIINTDAEGRLVLADALTYAERFNPQFVLDIATLTGAMVIALGSVATGFMTQDEELASLINESAEYSQDKAWRMPLDDAYQEAMDSSLADIVNASFDRSAGSITAACFLSRFTKKYRWAHLDIAGTAWTSGKNHHATGRPVPLLTQLLRQSAHES